MKLTLHRLALLLALSTLCLAGTVPVKDDVIEKRRVPWLRCKTPLEEDVVHITRWNAQQAQGQQQEDNMLSPRSKLTHVLDSRDLVPNKVTQDLEQRDVDPLAQEPIYLGLTKEKDVDGNIILGQADSPQDAPSFTFLTCPPSLHMGYEPVNEQGLTIVYGHLALTSDKTLCVSPWRLAKRNAAVTLQQCPVTDDSSQMSALFKFTRSQKTVNGKTTILSHMEFLGKSKPTKEVQINTEYSIRYDEGPRAVYIDGRAPNEKVGKGDAAVFAFNNRRKAK